MKSLAVLLCVVAAASAISFFDLVREEWSAFKLEHNKQYESKEEDKFRMKVYAENKHKIAKHNQRYEQGHASFRLKQNKYGDLLHHEFVHTMNGFNRTTKRKGLLAKAASVKGATFISPAHVTFPDQVDWRKKGAVTEIKDQGKCGSCWSFSTTGALEGQHFRKSGYLVSLSEQNLIDCSAAYGNNGCNGGLMDNAFKYIKDNGGIDTEKTYPYEAVDDKCRYNPKNSGADDVGFTDIPAGDEQKLLEAVATVGPVSVAIDASQESFQFYSDGVYYDENCSSENLDHGTGALEGQHFRKSGYLVSLSEQNLIDCSAAYGNNGCNGGLMDNAFKYIKDNGGIDTEKTYPYEAVDDKCRYNPKNSGADDVGFTDIPAGDEQKLLEAVATVGPVSVAIDASQESFQFYSDGVYYDENCSSENLDHGVLVVGYGTDEKGGDYWLVKNSWGRSWGDLGYIKMARNRDNHCGIASAASYPLV